MLKEKAGLINTFIVVTDVIIALISLNITLYIEFKQFPIFNKDTLILQLLIIIIWSLLISGFGLNTIYRSRPYSIILLNCFVVVIIGTCCLAIAILALKLIYFGLQPLMFFAAIAIFLTFVFKLLTYKFFKFVRRKGYNFLNILVIGDYTVESFLRHVFNHPEWGYKVVAVIGNGELEKNYSKIVPFLPKDTDVEILLRGKAIDEVVFCKKVMEQSEVEDIIQICSEIGVVFRMYSSFFNMLINKTQLHYFGTMPLLTISNVPNNYLTLSIKTIFDFLFSTIVLVGLSPLYLLIAIAIKLDSKGPVFFKQKRLGLRGRYFTLYKFRTMVVNAEEQRNDLEKQNEMDGPVFKIAKDPRITTVGRFLRKSSLDELPQFFNVLRGDMSVVGPRPPIPEEVKQYERWQLRRLSMKPGITCIWQVSGRNRIQFEEWMKMDMEYIDNWSLKIDIVILLKTVRTILRFDGE